MSTTARLLILFFLLTVIVSVQYHGADAVLSNFWRRCKKTDCKWGAWSKWSRCSQTCGPHGVEKRTRSIAKKAACGGDKCRGPTTQQRHCNRFCLHFGHLVNGRCTCSPKYYGFCCQYRRGFRGRSEIAREEVANELWNLN